MMKRRNRKHCYIDTETTGLEVRQHEIIEVAIITEHPSGQVERWSTKIAPERIENAHPRALQINGYCALAWEDAPSASDVAGDMSRMLTDAVVVGHNVAFDVAFLDALFRANGINHRWYHRAMVDTVTLTREHLIPTGLGSASVDNVRRWWGWSLDKSHTALKDAEDCRRLFHELAGAGWWKRLVWKWRGPRRMKRAWKRGK